MGEELEKGGAGDEAGLWMENGSKSLGEEEMREEWWKSNE